jgi:hypothetical protein
MVQIEVLVFLTHFLTSAIPLDLRRIFLRSCNYVALGVRNVLCSFCWGRRGRTGGGGISLKDVLPSLQASVTSLASVPEAYSYEAKCYEDLTE